MTGYRGTLAYLYNAALAQLKTNIHLLPPTGSDNSINNAVQVCAYTVTYNPTTNLGNQQMTDSGQFPSTCKGLNFLTIKFTIEPATLLVAQSRLVLTTDDVNITTYRC